MQGGQVIFITGRFIETVRPFCREGSIRDLLCMVVALLESCLAGELRTVLKRRKAVRPTGACFEVLVVEDVLLGVCVEPGCVG